MGHDILDDQARHLRTIRDDRYFRIIYSSPACLDTRYGVCWTACECWCRSGLCSVSGVRMRRCRLGVDLESRPIADSVSTQRAGRLPLLEIPVKKLDCEGALPYLRSKSWIVPFTLMIKHWPQPPPASTQHSLPSSHASDPASPVACSCFPCLQAPTHHRRAS